MKLIIYKRRVITFLYGVLIPLCSLSIANASTFDVTVLLSSNDISYRSVTEQLIKYAPELTNINILKAAPDSSSSHFPSDLIVAIGSHAFETALIHYPQTPILASFIPKRTYELLKSKFEREQTITSGVFIDQPMERQLHLARILAPEAQLLGTLFGESSLTDKPLFEAAAAKYHFTPQSHILTTDNNPINTINPLISNTDLFLAIPDQGAFNRASAKWSLYLALKHKKPLIGFSETYVNAGALASVYSTPAQVGKQTGEMLAAFKSSKQLPPPAYPIYFDVKVNDSTARQLNISPPPLKQLQSVLRGNSKYASTY